jgi:hypothetical protein
MGYELEMPTRDFYAATVDLRRLEHAACDADRRLNDALARSRQLRGQVGADDPVWLAAQIRIVEARHRWKEAIDALSEIAIDMD